MKKKAFFGNSNKGELQVKKGSHGLIAGGPNIEIAKTDATIYNESPTYFKLGLCPLCRIKFYRHEQLLDQTLVLISPRVCERANQK